ncbi:MAG: hypothetical protein HRT51_14925 [Colwellia sp.]|nr:hypothetical protein [Colwellia sp.]
MSSITNNNYAHLRIFNDGLLLDLCIEPSSYFGKLFPSLPLGAIIKLGSIRDLKAKGLIKSETIFCYELEYKRYSISDLGKKLFMEYKNDCSK